jgi:hypothetical protein
MVSGLCGDVGDKAERGEREGCGARPALGEVPGDEPWVSGMLVFIESPLEPGRRSPEVGLSSSVGRSKSVEKRTCC